AYFRTHKQAKQRKAFVKKQKATLARLREAAACEVPPADTTPPRFLAASASGATVTLTFDEDVVAADVAAFAVRVNGAARSIQSVTSSGKTVVLALAQPVGGDDVIALDYSGGVKDAAGNAAPPAANVVVANATPAACSFMVSTGALHGGQNE